MDFDNLGKTIANFAPILGAMLPIPGGAAIGAVIAHEFGGSINNPDDLISRIVSDPNAGVKLLEIQSNCKVQLQQLAVQQAQNELTAQTAQLESDRLDRADARNRNSRSWMPEIVTFILVTGFFGIIAGIMYFHLSSEDEKVLYILLGTVSTSFTAAVSYWLGSSAGSKNKDKVIHSALENMSSG